MRLVARDDEKVLRAFVKRDRLVSIPAREGKKRVVLRYLLDTVLPDASDVAEPELNSRLAAWHPDVAALRRYLVDSGFATRIGMVYRRTPGLPARAPDAPRKPDPGGPPAV
jgi:hypothetical protein